jgi:hypothetical protein
VTEELPVSLDPLVSGVVLAFLELKEPQLSELPEKKDLRECPGLLVETVKREILDLVEEMAHLVYFCCFLT